MAELKTALEGHFNVPPASQHLRLGDGTDLADDGFVSMGAEVVPALPSPPRPLQAVGAPGCSQSAAGSRRVCLSLDLSLPFP